MPGLLLITDEKGSLVYANRAIEERSGFTVAEAVGSVPGRLWGGRMPVEFYRDMWKQIGEEGKTFSAQVENKTKHGKIWPSRLSIAPVGEPGSRLFLAIQPEAEAQTSFADRFSTEWEAQATDGARLAGWLARWLGGDEEVWMRQAGREDAAAWIRRAFVRPMEERFIERRTDGALLGSAKADPQSFSVLYAKYWPIVRGYFRRHLSEPSEAEDLAQEVFIRAFSSLQRFEIRNAIYETYLLRIAHRLLLNRYRVKTALPLEDMPEPAAPGGHPDEWLDRAVKVEGMLRLLRGDERALVEGFYLEGKSIRDLAAATGKSENAVKLVLSRARIKLRRAA